MKLLTVIGARPQFIKASALSRSIKQTQNLTEVIVHTGQHFDSNMSDVFFSELKIPTPDYHLGIAGGGHGQMTGRQLEQIEKVLLTERPDIMIVYGDTNSTLAGALAAAKLSIPVAHIEAGLRSFNRAMPEEINRVMTDHISDWLFTPTKTAAENLLKEGISQSKIFDVGDIMYDTALFFSKKVKAVNLDFVGDYILTTIHRAENTNDIIKTRIIFDALMQIAKTHHVVFPLHPRTRNVLKENDLLQIVSEKLHLIEPVGYLDMVALERDAKLIITDSGGVQKEAYFQGVPCVTLRDETEWVELIDAGVNRLAPPVSDESIISEVKSALRINYTEKDKKLYGDGQTAQKICKILTDI